MNTPNLEVINDYVIIKPLKEKPTTETGFVVQANKDDRHQEGTLAYDCGTLKAGDRVLFNPYTPKAITFRGQELLVLERKDIFALITDSNGS
jgi:co-chaperonin GroES (HSP10)